MFSLQQLMGKGDQFLNLLERSAEEAHESVCLLVKLLEAPESAKGLDDFVMARRKEKQISAEISERLVRTFITGLEREDIEALSSALYKVPKSVEKFAERYLAAATRPQGAGFARQADKMRSASEIVVTMVKQLRQGQNLERIKDLNDRLQYVEGEADKLMIELFRDLYSGKYEPLQVVITKDLYELMEKIIDRARDAGNVVVHIVLKSS
jgi:uncharacterized protein Yka (UPF0111/DUF47 family)